MQIHTPKLALIINGKGGAVQNHSNKTCGAKVIKTAPKLANAKTYSSKNDANRIPSELRLGLCAKYYERMRNSTKPSASNVFSKTENMDVATVNNQESLLLGYERLPGSPLRYKLCSPSSPIDKILDRPRTALFRNRISSAPSINLCAKTQTARNNLDRYKIDQVYIF